MTSIRRQYGPLTLFLMSLALIVLLTGVAVGLQTPIRHKFCPAGPTASKTQSKLWFNDGSWWSILFDGASEEYRIFRYDPGKKAWDDTGTLVDARNTSRADA